jgi:hypothetical protein
VLTIETLAGGWVAAGQRTLPGGQLDLFLLVSGSGATRELPPPPGREALRGVPVLLLSDEAFEGVAWLEGDRQEELSVRAARWTGDGWLDSEVVSPRGPGAQLALDGAVLADGSWLLVWAAVDGRDDEILWSLRRDGRWSAPLGVLEDNEVPDITPALAPLPDGGALAVWSHLDGRHYRLRSARFDGTSWSGSAPFGRQGSTRPGFVTRGDRSYLLYSTVVPDTWSLLEYDRSGAAQRSATIVTELRARPLFDPGDPEVARLVWPAQESEPEPGAVPGPDSSTTAIEVSAPWSDLP